MHGFTHSSIFKATMSLSKCLNELYQLVKIAWAGTGMLSLSLPFDERFLQGVFHISRSIFVQGQKAQQPSIVSTRQVRTPVEQETVQGVSLMPSVFTRGCDRKFPVPLVVCYRQRGHRASGLPLYCKKKNTSTSG